MLRDRSPGRVAGESSDERGFGCRGSRSSSYAGMNQIKFAGSAARPSQRASAHTPEQLRS
ncbi:hypothetical protein VARIO8X_50261 [Burkholderiales bacterium 8X]|nr:hypothetical protein VARIO8X_50261 [Burkholderiales bacterium 8X]